MYTATQFAIPLDGKPGTLAHVLDEFERSGIGRGPMMLSVPPERSALRLVVDNRTTARRTLRRLGMRHGETEVICLDFDNAADLGPVVEKLTKADVKVWYAYCAGGKKSGQTTWVIRVRDVAKAMELLQQTHGTPGGSQPAILRPRALGA